MNIYDFIRMASTVTQNKKQYMRIQTNTSTLHTETLTKTYNFANQYSQTVLSEHLQEKYCLQKFLDLQF